jgi:hypothetical protein
VHYAVYEFGDVKRARDVLASDALKRQAQEFDRAWGGKVSRGRDIVDTCQSLVG